MNFSQTQSMQFTFQPIKYWTTGQTNLIPKNISKDMELEREDYEENKEKCIEDCGYAISNSQMDFQGFLFKTLIVLIKISWVMWTYIVQVKK